MKKIILLGLLGSFFIIGFYLLGCASTQESATTTTLPFVNTSTTTTTTLPPWTEQTLTWTGTVEPVTSTCTIVTPEGTYRMYFTGQGGIWTATSTDGLSWATPVLAASISGATNPSVLRLTDGTFLMLYGIQPPLTQTERLYRATSTDGITFTQYVGPYAGGSILSGEAGEDFVSVPDMLYINSTTVRLYYVGSATTSRIYTATSTDKGITWTREDKISITPSSEYGGQTNDPDVVQEADGTYRLYFTAPPAGTSIGSLEIRSASSTDGRSFTMDSGYLVKPSGSTTAILDPDTVAVSGTTKYRLYYGTEPAGDLHGIISP